MAGIIKNVTAGTRISREAKQSRAQYDMLLYLILPTCAGQLEESNLMDSRRRRSPGRPRKPRRRFSRSPRCCASRSMVVATSSSSALAEVNKASISREQCWFLNCQLPLISINLPALLCSLTLLMESRTVSLRGSSSRTSLSSLPHGPDRTGHQTRPAFSVAAGGEYLYYTAACVTGDQ